jgi:hypothetical protein
MNADGSDAHAVSLPGGTYAVWGGTWAPDSSHALLYGWGINPPRPGYETFLVDVDGREFRPLRMIAGAMSPDGNWIAGMRRDPAQEIVGLEGGGSRWRHPATGTYSWEVVLTSADGTDERQLLSRSYPTADSPGGPTETNALSPARFVWSPDSRQIAFTSAINWRRKGPPTNKDIEVLLYDLPSGRLTQVTHDDIEQRTPVWVE